VPWHSGAIEALTSFIALVGMRGPGMNGEKQPFDFAAPEYFLRKSIRHAKELLAKLNNNDDRALLAAADSTLGKEAD
jgi:hypothetical protein